MCFFRLSFLFLFSFLLTISLDLNVKHFGHLLIVVKSCFNKCLLINWLSLNSVNINYFYLYPLYVFLCSRKTGHASKMKTDGKKGNHATEGHYSPDSEKPSQQNLTCQNIIFHSSFALIVFCHALCPVVQRFEGSRGWGDHVMETDLCWGSQLQGLGTVMPHYRPSRNLHKTKQLTLMLSA